MEEWTRCWSIPCLCRPALVLVLALMLLVPLVAPGAALAAPQAGDDWTLMCVDCPRSFDLLTDRSLHLDTSGHPHVAYGQEHLYYAWYDGASWHYETADTTVAGDHGVGTYAALDLDSSGYPHISYFANGEIRYAYKDAGGWHVETVDNGSQFGGRTSIQLDSNGYPHMGYFASANMTRYAYRDATGWHSEDVLYTGHYGDSVSLALDPSNQPHLSMMDNNNNGALKYATKSGGTWQIESVAGIVNANYTSLALDGNNYPHISCSSSTASGMIYAYWDGSDWHSEIVESGFSGGRDTSIALDGNDHPYITYYYFPPSARDLKIAYHDGTSWTKTTIDSQGDTGMHTSVDVDGSGNPHVTYLSYDGQDLKYAYYDGSWHTSVADNGGAVGYDPDVAIDGAGHAHISYWDLTSADLKYAAYDGTSWTLSTVDSTGEVGRYTSIALDGSGYPHISYYDLTYTDLKYAYWDGSDWQIETVDSSNDVGQYSSLALDDNDYPHISYHAASPNYDLKYAYWDGSDWQIETVDSSGNVGQFSSLGLDGNDYPHIGYYDVTNKDLKYAHWDGGSWQFETVQEAGEVGEYTSLAVSDGGQPHIASSYDAGFLDYRVRYAAPTTLDWSLNDVAAVGGLGGYTSIALDGGGYPFITFHTSDELVLVFEDDIGPKVTVVTEEENSFGYNAVAVGDDSLAHIAFYSDVEEGLMYAHQQATPAIPAEPACNRYVDQAHACNGWSPCHTTLAAAVASSMAGDGICIFPGWYAESVDLSTMGTPGTLGLTTVNAAGTATPGTATVSPTTGQALWTSVEPFLGSVFVNGLVVGSPDEDGLELSVSGYAVLQNMTANGTGDDGLDLENVGLGVIISDCVASDNNGYGISLYNVAEDVRISGCEAQRNGDSGIELYDGYGHVVVRNSQANNNTGSDTTDGIQIESVWGSVWIEGCTTSNNQDDGIDVDDVDGTATFTDTVASDNGESGIDTEYTDRNVLVQGCTAEGNESGIFAISANDVTIRDSVASGNSWHGISVAWDSGFIPNDIYFTDLTTSNNGEDGIQVDTEDDVFVSRVTSSGNGSDGLEYYSYWGQPNSSDLTVTGSFLTGNGEDGYYLDGANSPGTHALNGNLICGNTGSGVWLQETFATNVEGNWWGAASGPSHSGNPEGTGDVVGGQDGGVDYTPWIDTVNTSATVDPITVGQPTVVRFQFSGGTGTAFLVEGPGDPNATPPFQIRTDNGELAASTGTGSTVNEFINKADGVLEVTLVPWWGDSATVRLEGPCGLAASVEIEVTGEVPGHLYLPVIYR